MDKIGIITVTFNSEKVLEPFLTCIQNQNYKNYILVIVDNDSSDLTLDILNQQFDNRIKTIKNNSNLGVAKANNQGVDVALNKKCDKILFLNNDVEFSNSFLRNLVEAQRKIGCSLIAPKMMYFKNPKYIWYAGAWFVKNKGFLPIHRGINELDKGQYNNIAKVDYAPTCCLMLDKQVIYDIGLMDEKYFVYFDDTDFAYRIYKDKRHHIYYYPDEVLLHKVGSLTKSFVNNQKIIRGDFFLQQNTKNHVYFLKKIGGLFSYLFIVWLFFKNNLKFIFNSDIKKDFTTFLLINRSYFKGLKM